MTSITMNRLALSTFSSGARMTRAFAFSGLCGALLLGGGCAHVATRSAGAADLSSFTSDADAAVLGKLNQMLDSNQAMEELLRENSEKLGDEAFRQMHAEWDAYLNANPATLPALKNQRGFFLHREITRVARLKEAPLLKQDIASFDAFLFQHPDILRALDHRPALVGQAQFLIDHPVLAAFFDRHPSLSTVLLIRTENTQATL